MKSNTRISRFALLTILVGIGGLLIWTVFLAPRHPVALLRVVDGAGKPIAGAIIRPEGLRTKPGPYVSGWYGWRTGLGGVPNPPVTTDAEGHARVPYPKYVFERIETGTLCLSVEHPDYVPDRPERMVALAPPGGSPWRAWFDYIWARVRHKALVARAEPIILQQGAILRLSATPSSATPDDLTLYAQVSGLSSPDSNFWIRPGPAQLVTKRLRPGPQAVRAVQLDSKGTIWFSPITNLTAIAGQTSEITLELKPGATIHGRLDDGVPRPVRDGRVIAHVWPPGQKPSNYPPDWHAWMQLRADGTFEVASLPEGELELVAVCDGFVSTNGPGQFRSMHYPQKFQLGSDPLDLVIGMEPTATLEVQVRDDQDKPLPEANISAWPNVRYGEWSATIIGQDCRNTADSLRTTIDAKARSKARALVRDSFRATSDNSGLAILRNLPAETRDFTVEHAHFVVPASDTGSGQKRREVEITLQAGMTNHVKVRLEPAGQTEIGHY